MLKAIEELNTDIKKDIIIDKIMKSKGVYLLVSNPKVGKSMLALQLSNSIVNGIPFLGYKVNPSPVLYISTESGDGQLYDRLQFMDLHPLKGSLFIKERDSKSNIDLKDLELDIQDFALEKNGKLIILDMLKDINFGVEYDINSYQDVAQKVMPKLRYYCEKYNVTFLVTHHLNKRGDTLGSIALDAVVDGTIRLTLNKTNNKYLKLTMTNRDFPELDIQLKRNENQTVEKCNVIEDEDLPYELIIFIKHAIKQKSFDFTCGEIISKTNIMTGSIRLGKLLSQYEDVLKEEGITLTKNRTSDARIYHCEYNEPEIKDYS